MATLKIFIFGVILVTMALAQDISDPNSITGGIMDGIYNTLNTTLKSLIDGLLTNWDNATGGILTEGLKNIRVSIYAFIDRMFPATTTNYNSMVYY